MRRRIDDQGSRVATSELAPYSAPLQRQRTEASNMMISVKVKAGLRAAAGLLRGGLVGFAAGWLAWSSASAQAPAPTLNPLGVWRGTSLCQVHPSPCHDETVVYRITPIKMPDSVSIDARKVVSGQEEQMGVFGCRFTAANAAVTCTMPNGVWRFVIRGDSLTGDLRLPNNTKYRDVRTARARN
jgi:hypothetical protein